MKLENQNFGKLTVISKDPNNKNNWICLCACGKQKSIYQGSLTRKRGNVTSCGCNPSRKHKDLTGRTFHYWTVINIQTKRRNRMIYWNCRCKCGVERSVRAGDLLNNTSKSCGCWNLEAASKKWSKEKNPSWNPDLSNEERLQKRNINEFRNWRKAIYHRDNYTCQKCFQQGGSLNAHHLDGWHWCVDRRFDIDNGVTLCRLCHLKFHKRFGRKNNTKEQFNRFINV